MEPQDLISIMPEDVITNILNRLPADEAVKTSILARNWRFKWTMLTQLVLDENFFPSLVRKRKANTYMSRKLRKKSRFKWKNIALILFDRKSCQHLPVEHRKRNISGLPFLIRGPITKSVLHIDNYIEHPQILDLEDVNHWVLYLSRKGIWDLTLENRCSHLLKLPSQIYSCMELKHLKLHGCHLQSPSSFHCLPNLLSLALSNVTFEGCTCVEFIAWCPLLENLTITGHKTATQVKLIEIAEFKNLKILSVQWDNWLRWSEISLSSIFLLSSLPKIQDLNLNFCYCKLLAAEGVKKEVSAAFLCLKTLNLSEINFDNNILVSSIFEMICGSPNLQTLKIKGQTEGGHPPAIHSLELDCKTKGQLQLQSVVFAGIRGLENEVCLIKFILAQCPLLKKFVIRAYYLMSYKRVDTEQLKINWELAMKLLKLHRASPVAEIDLCGFLNY